MSAFNCIVCTLSIKRLPTLHILKSFYIKCVRVESKPITLNSKVKYENTNINFNSTGKSKSIEIYGNAGN